MKKALPRLIVAAAVLACPIRARALFGAGDIVYDPASVAQTINVLHAAQQQFDRLGTLLGVSTQQFDQLVSLVTAIGRAGTGAQALSPAQLQSIVQTTPGLSGASLQPLFNTNNQLDAFLGVSVAQWIQAVENPTAFLRTILTNPAIARVGSSAGLSSPSISYAQWYAARTPEDQANLGSRSAADFSNLTAGDWLQSAEQRRINLQALAAESETAKSAAGQAQTLSTLQQAQAQLNAGANHILLETAAQAADAQETAVRAASVQNRLLQDAGEVRRDAAELQLDLAW